MRSPLNSTGGRRRDERGATAILIALSMISLMGVVGIVMDGGFGFSDRRQSQNAADAAALAGAHLINNWMLGDATVTPGTVWGAVQTYSSQSVNNTNQTPSCWFIDEGGFPLNGLGVALTEATAPQCSTFVAFPLNVTGVEVTTSDVKNTNFIKAVGINSFTAGAPAKAQVEKATLTSTGAPIMLCAVGNTDPRATSGVGVQQYPSTAPQVPILDVNNNINQAAIGKEYWIKGVEVKNTCTGDANFKGLTNDAVSALPGPWTHQTGNTAGPTRVTVANACGGFVVGCQVFIPLCYANPAPGGDWWCTQLGTFQISFADANSYRATFVGGGTPNEPTSVGGGKPGIGDLRVVRLSQ
jgi:hypothetical protein